MAVPCKFKFQNNIFNKHKTNQTPENKTTNKHAQNYQKSLTIVYGYKIWFELFSKCLVVLQCLIMVANEFHKVGPVTRIDRSENIFWLYEYYKLGHFSQNIYEFGYVQ